MDKNLEKKFDVCVLCKKKTNYLISTPINLRKFYVEGAGQLCKECYEKVYKNCIEEEESNHE